ncbi:MAG: 50S ribosomal protein L15 [Nitrospirae bacterium]|nr:MAG: 50S ribosomal protein L15 [Nitrospirota bacterium]
MKLHELHPLPGAKKKRRRVGRGPGSGSGKTAGRGHKGLLARAGRPNLEGFEGGQMPLARRLPKRGFRNPFSVDYAIVNLKTLATLPAASPITPEVLREKGLIKHRTRPVKILGVGELSQPLIIEAHKFSQTAIQKIQQAGGQAKVISRA